MFFNCFYHKPNWTENLNNNYDNYPLGNKKPHHSPPPRINTIILNVRTPTTPLAIFITSNLHTIFHTQPTMKYYQISHFSHPRKACKIAIIFPKWSQPNMEWYESFENKIAKSDRFNVKWTTMQNTEKEKKDNWNWKLGPEFWHLLSDKQHEMWTTTTPLFPCNRWLPSFIKLKTTSLSKLSGAVGDLGTNIPIVLLVNNLNLTITLVYSALYNIATTLLFGLSMLVQPMKSIAIVVVSSAPPLTIAHISTTGLSVPAVLRAPVSYPFSFATSHCLSSAASNSPMASTSPSPPSNRFVMTMTTQNQNKALPASGSPSSPYTKLPPPVVEVLNATFIQFLFQVLSVSQWRR